MHIAYLTPEYPHPQSNSSGGLGTSISNMANALIEKGVKVSLVIYGQETDSVFGENGIEFHLLRQRKYKIGGWFFYRKYIQNYLNRISSENQIDLIEAPDWTGITAFMKLNIPLVIRMNGSDAYFCKLDARKQKWKNHFFEGKALRDANALVSVSKFTAEVTREIFDLKKSISIIPNSIEIKKFNSVPYTETNNEILYFGTIIRKKGVLELAEIFNKVVVEKPNTKLIFLGKDSVDVFEGKSTLELFRKRLTEEGLRKFEHIQEVSYSEVIQYLHESSLVVLPSFAEALPMTWLEAMAMEKALVTSDVGWAPEIMSNGLTGYTVDPKDHDSFAEKIIYLLDNPELRKLMGKEARKKVEKNFAAQVIVDKNINFYNNQLKV